MTLLPFPIIVFGNQEHNREAKITKKSEVQGSSKSEERKKLGYELK